MIKKFCHLIRQEVQLAKPNQKKVVPDVSLANQPYVKNLQDCRISARDIDGSLVRAYSRKIML